MDVGHDSTSNITAVVCLQRRAVFLKGRDLSPSWTKKKKAMGINRMCVFWQNDDQ